jgi:hypothetical protein
VDDAGLAKVAEGAVDVDPGIAGGVADLVLRQVQVEATVLDVADLLEAGVEVEEQRGDRDLGARPSHVEKSAGELHAFVLDAEQEKGAQPRMLLQEPAERVERDGRDLGMGQRHHRLRRDVAAHAGRTDDVAGEMDLRDEARAFLGHYERGDPAAPQDEEFVHGFALAPDRPALRHLAARAGQPRQGAFLGGGKGAKTAKTVDERDQFCRCRWVKKPVPLHRLQIGINISVIDRRLRWHQRSYGRRKMAARRLHPQRPRG